FQGSPLLAFCCCACVRESAESGFSPLRQLWSRLEPARHRTPPRKHRRSRSLARRRPSPPSLPERRQPVAAESRASAAFVRRLLRRESPRARAHFSAPAHFLASRAVEAPRPLPAKAR